MDYQKEFKKALLSRPHSILGKRGISNEFIKHVMKLLKRYKVIKIKALKTVDLPTFGRPTMPQVKAILFSFYSFDGELSMYVPNRQE